MKSAIVGLGVIGKVHLSILSKMGADIVAVCDIDTAKSACAPNVPFYVEYVQMLEKAKPDVVHICTPHYIHADMIIEALKRDIHVLCEKPLCIKNEEIARILTAERNSRAQLGVCLQNRYTPQNLFLKDYLADKEILGGNGSVVWKRDAAYYKSGVWRGKWSTEGGGVLINQALHTLDLLQWIVGFPAVVVANISNHTLKNVIETEDTVSAVFDTGDKKFTFYATTGGDYDYPVELTLRTKDEIVKLVGKCVYIGNKVFDFSTQKYFGKSCYGSGHEKLIAEYYACVKNGKKFAVDGAEAAKVASMIFATYKSNGEWTEIRLER